MAKSKRTKATDGKNIKLKVVGDILTITIDLSKEVGPSKSGTSILIATAGPGIMVDNAKLNLNLYETI